PPFCLSTGTPIRRQRQPVGGERRSCPCLSDRAQAADRRQHRQPATFVVGRLGRHSWRATDPVLHAGGADHPSHPAAGRDPPPGGRTARAAAPMRRVLMALLAAAITALCLWVLLTPQVPHSLGRLRADAKPAPLLAAFVLSGLVQWLRAWRFAARTSAR